MQRVWREIDVHEKLNIPFVYKAEGDNGNQRFIMILLNAIKKVTSRHSVPQAATTGSLHLCHLGRSLN